MLVLTLVTIQDKESISKLRDPSLLGWVLLKIVRQFISGQFFFHSLLHFFTTFFTGVFEVNLRDQSCTDTYST